MMGMIATVWAAVVDPRYVRPEHLKKLEERVEGNQVNLLGLQEHTTKEIGVIKISIYEMRIDMLNTRLIEIEALSRQRKLRADEIYQQKEYQTKLQRIKRELKRVEG